MNNADVLIFNVRAGGTGRYRCSLKLNYKVNYECEYHVTQG